jgi:flagellar biosynthesis protein FliR
VLQISEALLTQQLAAFILPMFRLLGLMSAAPILSARAFPVRARVGLAILIAILIAPMLKAQAPVTLETDVLLLMTLHEVLIGISIGFAARLVLAASEVAGELIGLQMGLSFAGFFDPQSGSANAIGRLVSTLALLTFVVLDGPQLLLGAVVRSFSVFPMAANLLLPTSAAQLVQLGQSIFGSALSIALPIVAMQLIVNFILGIVARIAPQFNVFSIGFPVTIGAGLLLLALGLPVLDQALITNTAQMLELLGL